jgi:hypothetical protein
MVVAFPQQPEASPGRHRYLQGVYPHVFLHISRTASWPRCLEDATPFKQAVRNLRGFGLGLLATLGLYNVQVFTTLSHTAQFYAPDKHILDEEKTTLRLLFAGPSGSMQAEGIQNLKALGFRVLASCFSTMARAARIRLVFRTSRSFSKPART